VLRRLVRFQFEMGRRCHGPTLAGMLNLVEGGGQRHKHRGSRAGKPPRHGERAYEVARKAARTARNKRDHRQARHYSHLALRIAELTKREVGLDTATEMAEVGPVAPPFAPTRS
jgi:hypothetical protein